MKARIKTEILVHGHHLGTSNWEYIVWGNPSKNALGRLPKGVIVALKEKADSMIFGTGASERNGKKEAEYTRDYLFDHFAELSQFQVFQGINLEKAKSKIEKILKVDTRSQNTKEEVELAAKIFREKNINRIIIVSSPAHIMRCLKV